jgi:omega-6 fatty acid desaturase (delta-12 desaturase)
MSDTEVFNYYIRTNKINESELFAKYKSSYKSAFFDLSIHTFFLSSSYYLLWLFRNSWLNVFTIPLLGLLNVKTFIIFHDCGHQSYAPNKTLNYALGLIISFLTYFSYSWSYRHYTHHLTNGNYENKYKFNYNELIFCTFNQYKNMSEMKRKIYKCMLSPYILFTFLTYIKILLIERFYVLQFFVKKYAYKPSNLYLIIDQIINNIGVILILYLQYKYSILYHSLLSFCISSSCESLLFFNQHTFNPPYVVNNETWNVKDSGLRGSSYIQMPRFLKYFTGCIEYHHIHHFNPKIPSYNLSSYHEEVILKSNIFDNIVELSMTDCYNNLSLSLYNETNNKYITFEEADEEIKKVKIS